MLGEDNGPFFFTREYTYKLCGLFSMEKQLMSNMLDSKLFLQGRPKFDIEHLNSVKHISLETANPSGAPEFTLGF